MNIIFFKEFMVGDYIFFLEMLLLIEIYLNYLFGKFFFSLCYVYLIIFNGDKFLGLGWRGVYVFECFIVI